MGRRGPGVGTPWPGGAGAPPGQARCAQALTPRGLLLDPWGCGARCHPSSFLAGSFTPRSGFAPCICAFVVVRHA